MLVPTGHALHARERAADDEEGYEFSVLGEFDADVWDLFQVIYDRIRQGLHVRLQPQRPRIGPAAVGSKSRLASRFVR